MNFQIVKFNRIYEVILMKSCFCMSFEFINIGIQPDWIAQIKFMADFVNRMKNFVCAGVIVINFYDTRMSSPRQKIYNFFCSFSGSFIAAHSCFKWVFTVILPFRIP